MNNNHTTSVLYTNSNVLLLSYTPSNDFTFGSPVFDLIPLATYIPAIVTYSFMLGKAFIGVNV